MLGRGASALAMTAGCGCSRTASAVQARPAQRPRATSGPLVATCDSQAPYRVRAALGVAHRVFRACPAVGIAVPRMRYAGGAAGAEAGCAAVAAAALSAAAAPFHSDKLPRPHAAAAGATVVASALLPRWHDASAPRSGKGRARAGVRERACAGGEARARHAPAVRASAEVCVIGDGARARRRRRARTHRRSARRVHAGARDAGGGVPGGGGQSCVSWVRGLV